MAQSPHNAAILAAARQHLAPLGLSRVGRSRMWTDDQSWWITNVEFQPSSWGRGSYLNVGVQWLWKEVDSRVFMVGHRVEEFHEAKEGEDFAPHADQLAQRAAREVERYRSLFPDVSAVGRYYVARSPDHWPPTPRIDGAIALGLLGDSQQAREWFDSYLNVARDEPDWARREKERVERLRTLVGRRPGDFRKAIEGSISRTRQNLKLPSIETLEFWDQGAG